MNVADCELVLQLMSMSMDMRRGLVGMVLRKTVVKK